MSNSTAREGLPPLGRVDARVLILGSFPSEISLERQEYYANHRNQFWKIMGQLFSFDPELPYATRCEQLLDHGISLWDVCKSARRAGSLDAEIDIASVVPNALLPFLATHPDIRLVVVNGQKASAILDRLQLDHPLLRDRKVLPSSSPAHAAICLADKTQAWSIVRNDPPPAPHLHELPDNGPESPEIEANSTRALMAVGLDPVGIDAFGWAIVSSSGDEFRMEAAGYAGGADVAITATQRCLKRAPDAVGIDSPQYWVRQGDRQADQIVRGMLTAAGGRGSTVLHVNSLMGACLVQGVLAAHLARAAWPNALITEAHPKALWRISKAAADFVTSLGQGTRSDHDAALAAFAALHGVRADRAWRDLRALEQAVWFPHEAAVSYWFPREVTQLSETMRHSPSANRRRGNRSQSRD